jgi:hypothetical protein
MPTSMRLRVAVASFVALAGPVTATSPARANGLQLAVLRRVVPIAEPAIAHDGRSVAYEVLAAHGWTLILSDAGDFGVPTPLAYEFYHDVRAAGTPVEFVVYPVNAHFPSDPVRSEDVLRRWEAWMVHYL